MGIPRMAEIQDIGRKDISKNSFISDSPAPYIPA
jgi:hypothetical protein